MSASGAGVPEEIAGLSVFRVLLRHPKLARWMSDFLMGMLSQGRLDARLRELAIMRVGWATRSEYEWAQHWRIAIALGLSAEDILGVRDWASHDGFGASERSILAAVDEVLSDGDISASTWSSCREHVSADPQVLLELVTAIGLWTMVSSQLRSLRVPLEDDVESWPPDGVSPG